MLRGTLKEVAVVWVLQVPGAGRTSWSSLVAGQPGSGPRQGHTCVLTCWKVHRQPAGSRGLGRRCRRAQQQPGSRCCSLVPPSLSSQPTQASWLAALPPPPAKGKGEVFPVPLEEGDQWATPRYGLGLEMQGRPDLSTIQIGS